MLFEIVDEVLDGLFFQIHKQSARLFNPTLPEVCLRCLEAFEESVALRTPAVVPAVAACCERHDGLCCRKATCSLVVGTMPLVHLDRLSTSLR